ncbi:MAG: diguanylate cyclase, partial [Rubrivivax sp.]|nr:diguanylate cyclase [Rubrivivax sp.]
MSVLTDTSAMPLSSGGDARGRATFVLMVDDQPMVGEAVRRLLADIPDLDYHYVPNPLDALAAVREIRPAVVLLDLVMPVKDGLAVLAEIRADPSIANTPVVMLSTTEDAQTKARAFEAGADDYLIKLPERVELQARVRYHARNFAVQRERDQAVQALRESQRRLQELNLQLLQLSQSDGLTGLANRRFFDETMDNELRRAERAAQPMSLLMIDIDHFKKYNDHYGHQQGDRCLKAVADSLRSMAR